MFSAALCVMVEPQRYTTAGMVSPFLLVPSSSALAPNLHIPLSKTAARHGPECIGTESNSVTPETHIHPTSLSVTLFGSRVFTRVIGYIKMRSH